MPDIFGLNEIQREPVGPVSIECLKQRPSRHLTLNQLLDLYARRRVFRGSRSREETPGARSGTARAARKTSDGSEEAWEYMSPIAERDHIKPVQDETQERDSNSRMERSIRIALNNPERSSPALAVFRSQVGERCRGQTNG